MEADIATQAVGLNSSADFSILNLFIRADIIVKLVIIMLIAASYILGQLYLKNLECLKNKSINFRI